MFDLMNDAWREITAAIELRKLVMRCTQELRDQFMGADYVSGVEPEVPSHENDPAEYVGNMLPQLVWNNPAVRVTSKRPVVQRELAKAAQHGLNRCVRDTDAKEPLTEICVDFLLGFGVGMVGMEATPGYEKAQRPPLRPVMHRIPPELFFTDPQAKGPREYRFRGHINIRDKDDLLQARDDSGRPLYDRKAVDKLVADSSKDYQDKQVAAGVDVDRIERGQVLVYEVYVPEEHLLYSLGLELGDGDALLLRKPRRYIGHRRGPYTMFGVFPVPSMPYPLSPLAISASLARELNAHVEQAKRQADEARRIWLVNSTDAKAVAAVKSARNGAIIDIPGFDRSQVEQMDFPGPTKETLAYIQWLRDRKDRKNGITQTVAGTLTGVTLGEVQAAQQNQDVRTRWCKSRFTAGAAEMLDSMMWHICTSNNVVFWVPQPSEGLMDSPTDAMGGAPGATGGSGMQQSPAWAQGPAPRAPTVGTGIGGQGFGSQNGGLALLAPSMVQGAGSAQVGVNALPAPPQQANFPGPGAQGTGPVATGTPAPGAGLPQPPPLQMFGQQPTSDGLFLGGPQPGQEDFDPDDLELVIEPYSMEWTDERTQQARMQGVFGAVTQAGPMMIQMPWVKWGNLFDDLMASMNVADGRKYLNVPLLEFLAQQQLQGLPATMGDPGDLEPTPGSGGQPAPAPQTFGKATTGPVGMMQPGMGPGQPPMGGAGPMPGPRHARPAGKKRQPQPA